MPTSRATRVTSAANERSWSTIVLMVFFSSRISPFTSTVIFLDRSPVGDGRGDLGDVAHLAGEVAGHEVDVVGEVLPGAGDALHVGLAAELAFGADLARHAGDFGGERAELVHHRVDGVLQLEDLALHVDGDLLGQVAVGDGGGDVGDVADLAVRLPAMKLTLSVRSFQVPATPCTSAWPPSLPSVPTSRATRVTSDGERRELVHHRVDGVLQLEDLARDVDGDLLATGRRWRRPW